MKIKKRDRITSRITRMCVRVAYWMFRLSKKRYPIYADRDTAYATALSGLAKDLATAMKRKPVLAIGMCVTLKDKPHRLTKESLAHDFRLGFWPAGWAPDAAMAMLCHTFSQHYMFDKPVARDNMPTKPLYCIDLMDDMRRMDRSGKAGDYKGVTAMDDWSREIKAEIDRMKKGAGHGSAEQVSKKKSGRH